MKASNNFCLQCRQATAIILDHEAADKICSECGYSFLDFTQIDSNSVYNTFSASTDEDFDQNPVSEIGDSCEIPKPTDQIVRKPKKGFRLIGTMAEKLGGASPEIKNRAREIYSQVDVLKTCRGRSLNSIMAACLYIASREHQKPKTLQELSKAAIEAPKRINRAIECIKKQLELQIWSVMPQELVERYCKTLGLENSAIEAAKQALHNVEEIDIRRGPKSNLAVIIYMITQLSRDHQVPVREIAKVTEITELTLRKSFHDISPHASYIIPHWYAKEEEIMKIPIPSMSNN
ncbi:Transcription factor TFIIB [Corchorus capsularis]|uniref:Transcription factor TFIIB n=1 Tax=Corchorus capsularis TaxID=210143 RepID=A0A1R3GRW5_COCAP|nr:Transcription factor TFIIB [Corchorus capsularis]